MQNSISRMCCAGLILAAAFLAACGDSGTSPAPVPGIQPQIINNVDNFQFQITAVKNYSGTLTYPWNNTGVAADVNQSCAVGKGTVSLTLIDNNGQQVYAKDLTQNGTFASSAGTAGNWKIRVTMWGVSGDLNFRCDKRTP